MAVVAEMVSVEYGA